MTTLSPESNPALQILVPGLLIKFRVICSAESGLAALGISPGGNDLEIGGTTLIRRLKQMNDSHWDITLSGAGEFHLRALAEPDVSLSVHPAPSFLLPYGSIRAS